MWAEVACRLLMQEASRAGERRQRRPGRAKGHSGWRRLSVWRGPLALPSERPCAMSAFTPPLVDGKMGPRAQAICPR